MSNRQRSELGGGDPSDVHSVNEMLRERNKKTASRVQCFGEFFSAARQERWQAQYPVARSKGLRASTARQPHS